LNAQAPGRVNIIGEHVDYNDGFILPFAIDKATTVRVSDSTERYHLIASAGYETKAFAVEAMEKTNDWTDYVKGAIYFLTMIYNLHIPPLHITVSSDVPIGAGLSSSAAIEVASIMAISHHMGMHLDQEEVYKLAQRIENEFVGVNCGIMDQFISVMGKKDHAVFLDTMTMEYEYVPINFSQSQFYILNSSVKHSLGDGEYNKRRSECENALRKLGKDSFRQLNLDELMDYQDLLDKAEFKRSRHVLSENQRVLSCRKALEVGDEDQVGQLLNLTHASLRDDYECSCEEIDFLVEAMIRMPFVRGARIMGGGFGGSIIFLTHKDFSPDTLSELNRQYANRYHREFFVYKVLPSQGAFIFD